jgi:hypothetical protein
MGLAGRSVKFQTETVPDVDMDGLKILKDYESILRRIAGESFAATGVG